jgi:hypothetical protein
MRLMPNWYGVTIAEISFNDTGLWPPVFARLSPDGQTLDRQNFPRALAALGFQANAQQEQRFWDHGGQTVLTNDPLERPTGVLDESMAYRFFLRLGISAKRCTELLSPSQRQPYFKLYWNQTRMGGREPAELLRMVTLGDALAALGLSSAPSDDVTTEFLEHFQRTTGIRLPTAAITLLSREGVERAVLDCHPNNPNLVPPQPDQWQLRRGVRSPVVNGDYAVTIMNPHGGGHEWAIVFSDGDDDARVYVCGEADEGEVWLLSAPTVGMFFWDLAQTGLAWYQDTEFEGGKRVSRTDIGLVPV